MIGTLAGLNAFAGPAALNAMSGEQYADFGTMNINNAAMFMGASASRWRSRVALRQPRSTRVAGAGL